MDTKNSKQKFTAELEVLIRSRYPLIYIATYEEERCLSLVDEMADKRQASLFVWSRTQGVQSKAQKKPDMIDPFQVLKWYEEVNEKSVLVLKDFHFFFKEPSLVRKLRDFNHLLKRTHKNIVFISPQYQVPPELLKEVVLLELPLPGREEIRGLVQDAMKIGANPIADPEVDGIIDSAMGLTWGEIENVLAKSLVSSGSLNKKVVQEEKKQVVKRSNLLEFVETGSANAPKVGGLESLKEWLGNRKRGFSEEARTAGLPLPKGILLVGVPGCGKSLTAMTVGKEWELPLLRLDMGKLFSGLVGSSESNMRQALSTCEAVAPCVLWIDEIEKGMSGMGSSGSSDGGTTSRVFGTFLTWMQEKKEPVFVVATANDISGLPPEFLRKGRFDEIFFVDLPSRAERTEIFKIHLEKSGVNLAEFKSESLLRLSEGFSGAEIEQAIVEARYQAFGSNQKVEVTHLTQVLGETIPLSKTQSDRIASLREWAKNRTRFASKRIESEGDARFEGRSEALELERETRQ